MRKETFNTRGFISILLILNLLVLTITGIGLFVAPSGRAARDNSFPPSSTLSGFGEKLSGIVSETGSPDTANSNG